MKPKTRLVSTLVLMRVPHSGTRCSVAAANDESESNRCSTVGEKDNDLIGTIFCLDEAQVREAYDEDFSRSQDGNGCE